VNIFAQRLRAIVAVLVPALSLAAQQKVQVAPAPKGQQSTQVLVQTECKLSNALCPVITGISADSHVVPGGTVRVFGYNLAYHSPQLSNFPGPFFIMGPPPGLGVFGLRQMANPLPPNLPCKTAFVCLQNAQWADTSVVAMLPPPDDDLNRFWGGAQATQTYLQVITDGGKSNKYPVKFSPLATVKSSSTYVGGAVGGQPEIQPRNGPPKKQGGGSPTPQPSPTPAPSPSTAAQRLQLQSQLRVLQAQLATAPPGDKPRLQEHIRQVEQQFLELQGTRPGQIKQ
jgi:hypothetical protein